MGMLEPSHGCVNCTTWACPGCPRNLFEPIMVKAYRRINHSLRPIAMQRQCVYRQRTGSLVTVIAKARIVQSQLASEPMYAGIFPSPAEVNILIAELSACKLEISMRNYRFKAMKDQKRKQLDMALAQQCKWINTMAQGDLVFMTKSGFDLSKSREPIQEPETARVSEVITLQEGVAIVKAQHLDNTRYYEVIVFGPNGYEKKATGLYADITVPDLPIGVILAAKARSVNHKGIGQWSNSVNFVLPISAD